LNLKAKVKDVISTKREACSKKQAGAQGILPEWILESGQEK